MNAKQSYQFGELSHLQQQNIIALIACAIRDPEHHVIHAGKSGNPRKAYGYYVELPGQLRDCVRIAEDWNLGHWLIQQGLVEHGLSAWKTLRFRPSILAWYREAHPLSDVEAKAAIGKYFHDHSVSDDGDEVFNPDHLSVGTGVPVERIVPLVRSMVGAGILTDGGRGRSFSEKRYKLTQDGHRWFSGGCRPDFTFGASVTVDVNIQMDQVIHAIAELHISDEQRKAYELIALKLERELAQDNVTWETTKDALDMASKAQEIAAPVIRLLMTHGDKILHAFSQIPL